jgi:hypothetical protein
VPIGVFITGLLLLMLGFCYDLLFAGIPYQDPTPELTASYEFHSRVAERIEPAGAGGAGIGAAGPK